jgi:acetolactate synthase-1/2/3 large subunit
MKRTGAYLTVYALEQIGIKYTFGIPGVHNTEIYDELNTSSKIEPILVTHEGAGAFMADAVSRTSDSTGTLVIVPAAGTTHAMSGIGEAFLDGIPMLVISGGVRRDSGKSYQLHQLDQGKLLDGIVKGYFLIEKQDDIIKTVYKAFNLANEGEPGPVFIEVPVELQMFKGEVGELPVYTRDEKLVDLDSTAISEIIGLIEASSKPCMYVGWGVSKASEEVQQLADLLGTPVATTLQGKSVFPADHPLHLGVGFGPSAIPAAEKAFSDCDCMIAIGVRFSELATGSFGVKVPENLIHIDINKEVFNKNYQAKITLESDAKIALQSILRKLKSSDISRRHDSKDLTESIAINKSKYYHEWLGDKLPDIVSPGHFFQSLQEKVPNDTMMVVDDGKHTFLAAELFNVNHPGGFISPTDFNCMGYCVPATIGVKLANPDKVVVGIVGDGALQMTGMELITAKTYELGVICFVFHDGELGQISQFQKIPLNRKTATVLGDINVEGLAMATGAHFISIGNDHEINSGIDQAIEIASKNIPVLVDVKIDYSKKTRMTTGVVKTNLLRFPTSEKIRFILRAIKRNVMG